MRLIGVSMSPHIKWGIAGVVVGLILFIVSPWLALAVIAAAIAIPAAAWMMLDESQRRRYRELRRRQRQQIR
jgi:ABC-type bacteriocin/lantibiotic exporter with double-glycine peptidase domain